MCGRKWDNQILEEGKLHYDDLHDLSPKQSYSDDQISENAMSGACGTCGEGEGCMLSFGGKIKTKP
jgi:hypothetical protein